GESGGAIHCDCSIHLAGEGVETHVAIVASAGGVDDRVEKLMAKPRSACRGGDVETLHLAGICKFCRAESDHSGGVSLKVSRDQESSLGRFVLAWQMVNLILKSLEARR